VAVGKARTRDELEGCGWSSRRH